MNDHYAKNNKLREENVELANKLKSLIEQYELREQVSTLFTTRWKFGWEKLLLSLICYDYNFHLLQLNYLRGRNMKNVSLEILNGKNM